MDANLGEWVASNLTAGAIGGLLGASLAPIAKPLFEAVFTKGIPVFAGWYQRQVQERKRVLATYRDPMLRAADDFQSRLYNVICKDGAVPDVTPDPYFTESTMYVVAQYFAWSEILKQRMRLLNYRDLSNKLDVIEKRIAADRKGFCIFRHCQREIGERMILPSAKPGEPRVLTYSEFVDRIHTRRFFAQPSGFVKSLAPAYEAARAIPRIGSEADSDAFERLKPIQHALIDLIHLIDDPNEPWTHPEFSRKACKVLVCDQECCPQERGWLATNWSAVMRRVTGRNLAP